MKNHLTAKFRVATGLVGLLVSVFLTALLLGLVPDRQSVTRQGRAALAEAIALNFPAHITPSEVIRLERILELIIERNADLLSAGIRRQNGQLAIAVGDHDGHWSEMAGEFSSDSQVQLSVFSGQQKWGQLELRFVSANSFWGMEFGQSQVIPLVVFLVGVSFIAFYFYLGKMLKHLDPSRAIPPRVRAALDTMAEGLMVVDLKGNIVLANSSLGNIVGQDVDLLIGQRAN